MIGYIPSPLSLSYKYIYVFPARFRFRFGNHLHFNSLRGTDPQKHPFSTCFQFHHLHNSLIHKATTNVTGTVAPMVAGESEGVE